MAPSSQLRLPRGADRSCRAALNSGAAVTCDRADPRLDRMHSAAAPVLVPDLELPSGRLIIGDPSALFGDARPVDVALPTGAFPIAVTDTGAEVRFAVADAAALTWTRVAGVPISSGYVALLDQTALEAFSELGDEPVDEFELLSERLNEAPGRLLAYEGLVVLPVPADASPDSAGVLADVLVAADAAGRPWALRLRF